MTVVISILRGLYCIHSDCYRNVSLITIPRYQRLLPTNVTNTVAVHLQYHRAGKRARERAATEFYVLPWTYITYTNLQLLSDYAKCSTQEAMSALWQILMKSVAL
jgi:hypothetical protein